ncbi:MAG: hypothetical protein IPM39_29515 [Chloroflexi bacterium]|nr:hypothetical protein [Chloroflexota bacterium]
MLFAFILSAACSPRPEPPPAPLPTTEVGQEEAPEYVMWLPVVASGNAPKAGVAFSSHTDGAARVALLGRSVAYWRGWQVGGSLPGDQWGLKYTPSLWCDFFARQGVTLELRPQMHVLDALGPNYARELLFLNEPDLAFYGHHGQCEVSPYRAAQLYAHVREKLPHARLVGPGISHVDYQNDFQWLEAWWRAVVALTGEPPDMAAWDVHNYIQQGDPLAPYDALEAWLEARGVDSPRFWISEWGSCSPARTRLMRAAFDSDPRIERHYWYDQYKAYWDGEPRCMTLFEEQGPLRLTAVGEAFIGDRNSGLSATNRAFTEAYP